MDPLWIVLGIIVVIAGYIWLLYNGLVGAKMRVSESWSGIDVQLKRRTDLIPNLVETVKGYAKHEREVFEKVTQARAALVSAKGVKEAQEADNLLTGALKSLFAVAEAYPDLKANQNFLQLQNELSDVEAKIAYARQFYNSNVMDYNTKIAVFPNVLLAGTFGFKAADFFEAEEEEKKTLKVDFSEK